MHAFLLRLTPHGSRLAILALLTLVVTGLAACGRKGPVRPQLAALPEAPAELRIEQQGGDFLLSWQIPERNQDGGPANDLLGFHIYRMIYTAADGCPTCRDPDELVAMIDLRHLEQATRLGKRIFWRDAAVIPDTGHAYLVVPLTVGGQEGTGAGLHRSWQEPPPPPANLRADSGERQVKLTWTAPASLPAGQVLLGYNLYRRPATGVFPPVPLNAAPLPEPGLVDFAGETGREAVYRITTVARGGELLIESAPSAEVAVTPGGAR